jgi:hypothetical protein
VQGTALAKNPYVYKENYNVGDIIKISFSGKSANTRVLSVTEHWSGRGEYAIEFEFGKPMNNLANQLQLMLRQIQRAGDNSSSTDSIRWYTIPTDTEMPKADVTFDTIGFIGDAGAGATFKLYYNSNGTGSKTYHVYFKQLAGTGKLTLTTGVGAVDLVVSVGTYVMIIYVDENGNISTQGSTPVNAVTAGNTQPVTSGAVSTAIGSAISNIPIIPLSDVFQIYNITSRTHNFYPLNLRYSECYAVPLQNKYFVFGRILFENGSSQGAQIVYNGTMQLSIQTNKKIYPTFISSFIVGHLGITTLYVNSIDDFWIIDFGSDITFDSSTTMSLTFCGWMDK